MLAKEIFSSKNFFRFSICLEIIPRFVVVVTLHADAAGSGWSLNPIECFAGDIAGAPPHGAREVASPADRRFKQRQDQRLVAWWKSIAALVQQSSQ